jgi:hypothetical protein
VPEHATDSPRPTPLVLFVSHPFDALRLDTMTSFLAGRCMLSCPRNERRLSASDVPNQTICQKQGKTNENCQQ